MTVVNSQPFEELQRMCRDLNAPVYIRHRCGQKGLFFARRPSCTSDEVTAFFASITKGERTVSEQ